MKSETEILEETVNILVVDDQPESLLAMDVALGPLGQNVVRARSGTEALKRLLALDFAVIILDVQMPGLDGFETAALVREREKCRSTPIIFLTGAFGADAYQFKGYSVGAVDYLLKPVAPEILRSKVEVFVELAKKSALLGRLNETLARQAAELEAANKELEAFSYAVSHDLRAPLRSIDGFSRALEDDCKDALGEKGQSHLARIRRSAGRMNELIDDLLQLSRMTRAGMQWENVNLTEMSREVAADLAQKEPERRVDVAVRDGLTARGDRRLLRAALENLFSNAWKYTAKRERASIEFGMTEVEGETAYFVRDNGAGFDMAYAYKLFVPFQRLHSASDFPGTGVGLATVQRIVRRHGGRIWAEGHVDEGAAFYFTLLGGSP